MIWLQKRPTGYYFRRAIPENLISFFGKNEIVISLGTKDLVTAKRLSLESALRIDDLFESARRSNPDEYPISNLQMGSSAMKAQPKNTSSNCPLLSEAHLLWEKQAEPSKNTKSEWLLAVTQFKELCGDKPIDQYEADDFFRYRDALRICPKHLTISYKKLPFNSLVALAERKAKAFDVTVSDATILKRFGALKSIFAIAVQRGFIVSNPASVIHWKRKPEGGERLPFSRRNLQTLFCSEAFATTIAEKAHAYWLPLLALFTGARLEELGQLHVSDVREIDGIWFLDINRKDGKTIKTDSSLRRIPLHQQLLNFGFVGAVENRRKAGERYVFPELHEGNGKCTKSYSKRFGRMLAKVGLNDPALVFHSFRHTFKDAARDGFIEEYISDKLTGHSSKIVGRKYGRGPSLLTLKTFIDKIDYGVDFSKFYEVSNLFKLPTDEAEASTKPNKEIRSTGFTIDYAAAFDRLGRELYGSAWDESVLRIVEGFNWPSAALPDSLIEHDVYDEMFHNDPESASRFKGVVATEAQTEMYQDVMHLFKAGLFSGDIRHIGIENNGEIEELPSNIWHCKTGEYTVELRHAHAYRWPDNPEDVWEFRHWMIWIDPSSLENFVHSLAIAS